VSGYETSFTSDENEVEATPEFQHDASDGGPQAESDFENAAVDPGIEPEGDAPASDDVLDAEQAGMTG
jgi:hypothetical protein